VNVRFDVYGATAEGLDAHARGVLADFGPRHEWTVEIEVAPYASVAAPWVGHVTARCPT
jgi:hypothetical protein